MSYVIQYKVGEWVDYVFPALSALLGMGIIYLMGLIYHPFRILPPYAAAFLGGLQAVYMRGLLVGIYIKLTKQYNSSGEWIAGGEGKPDKLSTEQKKEIIQFRLAILIITVLIMVYFFYKLW